MADEPKKSADTDPGDTSEEKAESRLARHHRIARELYAEPRAAGGYVRDAFISVWIRHGAGFYGLGWVVAFIVLEVNFFTEEIGASEGVLDFFGGQFFEYLFRLGFMSIINTLLAAIWPVYLLQWSTGYGFAVLVVGYFAFEKLLRPVVEQRFPELAAARAAVELKKQDKRKKKEKRSKKNKAN